MSESGGIHSFSPIAFTYSWQTSLGAGTWVDVARVTAALACYIIGKLAERYFPPACGTLSNRWIEYARTLGFSYTIPFQEQCKASIRQESHPPPKRETEKPETVHPTMISEELTIVEAPSGKKGIPEITEIETQPLISTPHTIKYQDIDTFWLDTSTATAHPSKKSFELGGQPATLYGMYYDSSERIPIIESEMIETLTQSKAKDPTIWARLLITYLQGAGHDTRHDLILKVGHTVIVSCRNFFIFTDQTRSKLEGDRLNLQYTVRDDQELTFILGSVDTLLPNSLMTASDARASNDREILAYRLVNHSNIENFSIMVLSLGRSIS